MTLRPLLYLAGALVGALFIERACRWTGTDLTHWLKDRERPSLAYDWTSYEGRG